jgi:hypothetical protein
MALARKAELQTDAQPIDFKYFHFRGFWLYTPHIQRAAPLRGIFEGTGRARRAKASRPLPPAASSSRSAARTVAYARARHAPSTRGAYRADFAIFSRWVKSRNLSPLPADPDAVAAFLAAEGGCRPQARHHHPQARAESEARRPPIPIESSHPIGSKNEIG